MVSQSSACNDITTNLHDPKLVEALHDAEMLEQLQQTLKKSREASQGGMGIIDNL